MRCARYYMAFVVSLACGTALAQVDPGSDSICIYFDEEGNSNCLQMEPPATIDAYLVVSNTTGPGGCFSPPILVRPSESPNFPPTQML